MKTKAAAASATPAPRTALEVLLDALLPGTKVKFAAKELGVVLPKMAAMSEAPWTPQTVAAAAVVVLGKEHRVTSPRLIGEALDWLAEREVVVRDGKNHYRFNHGATSHPVGRQVFSTLFG